MNSEKRIACEILWPPEGLLAYRSKMELIRRYIMPDGKKVPYANGIEDNDWQHTMDCVSLAFQLAEQFPELKETFNFEIIIPLLWLHEADEICGRQDMAHCPNENNDHNNFMGTDKEYSDHELEKIKEFINSTGLREPELWLQRLLDMEKPETCKDPNLLFAKLIDWYQASLLVALQGNFDTKEQKEKAAVSFNKTTGKLLKRILEIVKPQSPKAAEIIREKMLNQIIFLFKQKKLI
jgi:hypothetical protein